MAERLRKQRTIIYKRAEFNSGTSVLETLLKSAFETVDKPSKRRQHMGGDEDSNVRQVISAVKKQQSMLCGSLLMYEIGKDVAFVVEDDDADEYEIESQNPAVGIDDSNRKREVLQSALYFGVWGNHVVVVQSQALKTRQLERHLNWLLSDHTNTLSTDVSLALSDEPTQEARTRMESLQPKSVEIGTPFMSSPDVSTKGTTAVSTHRITGKVEQLLSAFLSDDVLTSLRLDEALDDANLEATLQLKYKRKSTESGYAALDQIARAMRHAEPEDTKIVTSSGSVISGDLLKLTGTISVDTYNGVVDNNDLFAQMYTWLASKFEEGSVG